MITKLLFMDNTLLRYSDAKSEVTGKIEYDMNRELAELLEQNKGIYTVGVVAAAPKKAKQILAKVPGLVDDIIDANGAMITARLAPYFGEDAVLITESEAGRAEIVTKYSVAYTTAEALQAYLDDPRSDGRWDAGVIPPQVAASGPSLLEAIKNYPWTPTRIILEVIFTAIVVGLLVWWLRPEVFDGLWQGFGSTHIGGEKVSGS